MKNISLWLFSALAGLIFIFLLNTSPLSRLGFGINIPVAWQSPNTENYRNCTSEERFADPDSSQCNPGCNDKRNPSEGIPFSDKRQGRTDHCSTDTNTLATVLNAFSGIGAGLLYSLIAAKRWQK